MAEHLAGNADAVSEKTCSICLEDPKDPLDLPCGHSFCEGCLEEWRSRYGVEEEMRRKCPICRARIPPSKEMVASLQSVRAQKQRFEDYNNTSSEHYHAVCLLLEQAEQKIGADWDGVTVLQDNNDKPAAAMPDYIEKAISGGKIKSVLKWINANRTEDRVNASAIIMGAPALHVAGTFSHLTLTTLLLQLGADIDLRTNRGSTAIELVSTPEAFQLGDASKIVRLLLSWGASFVSDQKGWCSREDCIYEARQAGKTELAKLLESELGGRRCEIVDLTSRPELNGKTCVADEYLPDSNEYKVTLETKSKEVLVLGPDNLKRRDRTPQDCGYYIEFKNGRTIRHDFDSSEDCQAFVAALSKGEGQPVVTAEAEARAEQAAAELLAELGLDDSSNNVATSDNQVKKSKKKKKGGKKKKN